MGGPSIPRGRFEREECFVSSSWTRGVILDEMETLLEVN